MTCIAPSLEKLAAGQSVNWLFVGDSTVYGVGGVINDPGATIWHGWVGLLGQLVGAAYNVNVNVRIFNYTTPSGGYLTLGTADVNGNHSEVLYTSSLGGSAPTLTLWSAGWPGAVNANYLSAISYILTAPTPDATFIQDGLNESSTATFITNYNTLIGDLRSAYGSTMPIILTTANPCAQSTNTAGLALTTLWQSLITAFLPGEIWPITPNLQASTNTSGVWIIDTSQCGITSADIWQSAPYVHPTGQGYIIQANWMWAQLNPLLGSATITTTPGKPIITKGTPVLPANWQLGNSWNPANANAVGTAINSLATAVTALGGAAPAPVQANWQLGDPYTADAANAVAAAVNTLSTSVSMLGGIAPATLPTNWKPGGQYTADSENTVEAAINTLSISVATLQGS